MANFIGTVKKWRQGNQTHLYIYGDHTFIGDRAQGYGNPNDGNPKDDFYWRQKSSSLNLVQIIPPVGLLYFTSKST